MKAVFVPFALLAALPSWAVAADDIPKAPPGTVFYWVDEASALHATDVLASVPEPYYSAYVARLRALAAGIADGTVVPSPGASTPPPPASGAAAAAPPPVPRTAPGRGASGPSAIEREEERRQAWTALVAKWRTELAAATTQLLSAEDRVGELRLNPILLQTPMVQDQLQQAEQLASQARTRVQMARKMLLDELPARARKEGVPPRWLQ